MQIDATSPGKSFIHKWLLRELVWVETSCGASVRVFRFEFRKASAATAAGRNEESLK